MRTSGTYVASAPRDYFPVQKSTTLGNNELADAESFGHTTPATLNKLATFNALRFFCKTTNHTRVPHFKTFDAGFITYFRTGTGSGNIVNDDSFISLDGHKDAYLPRSANAFGSNLGVSAMSQNPFYYTNGTTGLYQFVAGQVSGANTLWNCDNYGRTHLLDSTFHQVWVK